MPFTRPNGIARFQGISASRIGLPSVELDGELNAIADFLNSLGSYTANISEWAVFDPVITYLSATQFTTTGDHTATFLPLRPIITFEGSTPSYTAVDSASYAAGPNLTTVTVRDAILTVSLSAVHYALLGPELDKLSIPISGLTVPVISKAIDYVATKHDTIVLVDASGGARSITLPQVSLVSTATRGRKYMVVKTDSSLNHVTVVPNAGDSINGATSYVLFEQYQRAELWGNGGTDWKQVARKTIPSGVMQMFAGAAAPAGWFLCNGSAISRTTYADLYAAIGTVFGIGDGSTTFNLPDLLGRAPIGVGTGAGLSARAMGDKVGTETHLLVTAEMPAHVHAISNTRLAHGPGSAPDLMVPGGPDIYTQSTGGDTAHQNMQPSLAINFIIKV
jgi:microcystin-dependent protein